MDTLLNNTFCPLNGKRIIVDRFSLSDLTDTYIDWLNDPLVVRFSNQRFFRHNLKTCLDYFSSFIGSEHLFLKIVDQSKDQMIGTMTAYYSKSHKTVDMGILIGITSYWGKGFGREAWGLLLDWLSLQPNVRKITAGTMRPNHGMIRIIENSGLCLEAVRPGQELLDGEPQDLLYFGKFSGA